MQIELTVYVEMYDDGEWWTEKHIFASSSAKLLFLPLTFQLTVHKNPNIRRYTQLKCH
jgi:hypothetical protein